MLFFLYELLKLGTRNEMVREMVLKYLDQESETLLRSLFSVLFVLQLRDQITALHIIQLIACYLPEKRLDAAVSQFLLNL